DLVSACLNVDRKDLASAGEPAYEDADFGKARLRPDRALRSSDIGEILLFVDLRQVRDGCRSEFPLASDRGRMIRTQELAARHSMSRNAGGAAYLGDTRSASKSP